MKTFYICGYPRNRDGTIRKNARRRILDIEHDLERAKHRADYWRKDNRFDVRIFTGSFEEVKEQKGRY